MRQAEVRIEGVTSLIMRQFHGTPMLSGESPDDWEQRTWREGIHALPDGRVYLPGRMIHKCIVAAARYAPTKLKGRMGTFAGKFSAGIMPDGDFVLDPPVLKADVQGVSYLVPSNGKPGGGGKVPRVFPTIHTWAGKICFYLFDDAITPDLFSSTLDTCATFIGFATWTPQRGGYHGRFRVTGIEWVEDVKTIVGGKR